MRAGHIVGAVLVGSGLMGCGAAAEPPAPRSAASPTPLTDVWESAPRDAYFAPASRTLAQRGAILIGEPAPPPAPSRPKGRTRIEVTFHHADLENAMRLLADTGRFNLVVESGLSGSVTAQLRGVDAYDALLSIAEANGATVRYENGIVMVKRAGARAVR